MLQATLFSIMRNCNKTIKKDVLLMLVLHKPEITLQINVEHAVLVGRTLGCKLSEFHFKLTEKEYLCNHRKPALQLP